MSAMSKRQLVHRLLREAGTAGVTTAEFLQADAGSRFGARVQELRGAGYVIDARRVRAGCYLYTLRQSPVPRPMPPADVDAVELQLFELPAPQADYRDAA